MSRIFIAILLSSFTINSFSQELGSFVCNPALKNASFSIYIVNADNGKIIEDYNSDLCLKPASVLKLIISASALEMLGPDYTFRTLIGYTGTLNRRGILEGDIVIKGGGDPAFASPRFPEFYKNFPGEWINEIRALGIRRIKGRVITDDSFYDYCPVPSKWLWEDEGNYYGAGVFGASVYDNTYEIHLKTKSDTSGLRITRIEPPECSFDLTDRLVAAGTSDQGYVFAAPYSTSGWLAGSVPENMDDFILKASITDPPLLIARMITEKLRSAGILISGEPSTVRLEKGKKTGTITDISEINSPPLSQLVDVLNHESVNLYAEHLLKELGRKFRQQGSTRAGIHAEYSFLNSLGIDTTALYLEDGSGLSPVNAISTKALVQLLVAIRKSGNHFTDFAASLPDAGGEGTLKRYFSDPVFENRLKAKSGSMTRVRSYAGYIKTRMGTNLAFAAIINNFSGSYSGISGQFENILKEIILNK